MIQKRMKGWWGGVSQLCPLPKLYTSQQAPSNTKLMKVFELPFILKEF